MQNNITCNLSCMFVMRIEFFIFETGIPAITVSLCLMISIRSDFLSSSIVASLLKCFAQVDILRYTDMIIDEKRLDPLLDNGGSRAFFFVCFFIVPSPAAHSVRRSARTPQTTR